MLFFREESPEFQQTGNTIPFWGGTRRILTDHPILKHSFRQDILCSLVTFLIFLFSNSVTCLEEWALYNEIMQLKTPAPGGRQTPASWWVISKAYAVVTEKCVIAIRAVSTLGGKCKLNLLSVSLPTATLLWVPGKHLGKEETNWSGSVWKDEQAAEISAVRFHCTCTILGCLRPVWMLF